MIGNWFSNFHLQFLKFGEIVKTKPRKSNDF